MTSSIKALNEQLVRALDAGDDAAVHALGDQAEQQNLPELAQMLRTKSADELRGLCALFGA